MEPVLRASDAERDDAVEALRVHAAAGRLTPDELGERIAAAYSARTLGELGDLLADLPGTVPTPRRRPVPRARAVSLAVAPVALATLLLFADYDGRRLSELGLAALPLAAPVVLAALLALLVLVALGRVELRLVPRAGQRAPRA
jgi:hypothetical protein